jgi:hypothetical protein
VNIVAEYERTVRSQLPDAAAVVVSLTTYVKPTRNPPSHGSTFSCETASSANIGCKDDLTFDHVVPPFAAAADDLGKWSWRLRRMQSDEGRQATASMRHASAIHRISRRSPQLQNNGRMFPPTICTFPDGLSLLDNHPGAVIVFRAATCVNRRRIVPRFDFRTTVNPARSYRLRLRGLEFSR